MKTTETGQPTKATPRRAPLWMRLLMVIGLLLVAIALTAGGCPGWDESSNSAGGYQIKHVPTKKKYRIELEIVEESDDKISVRATVVWLGPPPPPGEVRLIWNPDTNGYNKSWEGDDPDSEDPLFGNWYSWVLPINPATGKTEPLTVNYNPTHPPYTRFTDTFAAVDGSDNWGNTSVTHEFPDESQAAAAAPSALAGERSGALTSMTAPLLDDYYLWRTFLWLFGSPETTMTTDLCQNWMDLLQAESTFIALRFPVQPPTLAYTEPYTLPVVFGEEDTPSLVLLDKTQSPFTPVLTASLEYKPRHFGFLENELPSASGEHWLALGVISTPTLTCPAGLNLGPDDWVFRSDVYLDLGGVKDTCADCILPFYYCYEGQDSPLAAALLSEMLPGDVGVASHQGWGITCLGPQPFRLLDWVLPAPSPSFDLHGSNTAFVTPTQVISLHHPLTNLGIEPVTITFDYSSALSIPWTIYVGNEDKPEIPLVGPLMLTGTARTTIWMVAEIPGETPSGAETVLITATDVMSDAQVAWTSDLLWVGEWVAPPPLPAWYRVYLPLVMR